MAKTASLSVKELNLDLKNFRTVPQKTEAAALRAMVSISPDWFWALMESLLDDGYHPTENIIVQKRGAKHVVREGNRRVAALKLAFGYLRGTGLPIPSHIEERLRSLDADWKSQNVKVPCAIYDETEQDKVDRIVTLTHGKGDRAGRDRWNPVARARHNRDASSASEPALDILEKYLEHGRNLTAHQSERWSGDYPLTVLEEALKRLAPRLDCANSRVLADSYPKSKHRVVLEGVMRDVGVGSLDFAALRNSSVDFAASRYGLPISNASAHTGSAPQSGTGGTNSSQADGTSSAGATTGGAAAKKSGTAAVSLSDPRSVSRQLKAFTPRGKNREKLVTLLHECRKLRLKDHPHAFCFLLRSMFEISAKAYCDDHNAAGGPRHTDGAGNDRKLVEILKDITKHLTGGNTNRSMQKTLHGAMVNLGAANSILSVTSMNQLIHNPRFSVGEGQISEMFHNVFPLLEEMNK